MSVKSLVIFVFIAFFIGVIMGMVERNYGLDFGVLDFAIPLFIVIGGMVWEERKNKKDKDNKDNINSKQ